LILSAKPKVGMVRVNIKTKSKVKNFMKIMYIFNVRLSRVFLQNKKNEIAVIYFCGSIYVEFNDNN
jgi:hypothetical protein